MKNSKKGISLIVLVITIIVIIILAAAVLLSIQNNNPIENANKARYSSDKDAAQSAFNILMGKIMADCQSSVDIKLVNAATGESGHPVVGTYFMLSGSDTEYVKYNESTKKYEKTTTASEKFTVDADALGVNPANLNKYTIDEKGVITDPAITD